ncbi:MAG TPA: thymidylate kinase [Actinoplanes sp.]|nr:thymidylate kinase [Actinoplanes sp.]
MSGHEMIAEAPARSRGEVRDSLAAVLSADGTPWAWQGDTGAPGRWVDDTGPADLDVWCAAGPEDSGVVSGLAGRHPCVVIAETTDPGRLRHTVIAVLTRGSPGIVDVTHSDLRVGPVLMVPVAEVTVDPARHRLTGAAAVADLLVRPVLRGRIPVAGRIAEARTAWVAAVPEHRRALAGRLTRQLGAAVTADLIGILEGAVPDPGLPRRARVRLAACSLVPGAVIGTWAQRRHIRPARRERRPFGPLSRGVVVALVGTDGSGKSTVAAELDERLRHCGLTTATAYFGMARGNLPGVALARRVLGVGGTGPATGPDTGRPGHLDHGTLRRLAAWYYAGEYGWRYLRAVVPSLVRGRVVIADRWVYDLRDSPWPGSPAARVAEWLVPAPDLLVLPDAPAEVIHRRKPERSESEQRAQQERFHRLLAEKPARCAEVVVDTSGPADGQVTALVAAVIRAAHTPPGRLRGPGGQGSNR